MNRSRACFFTGHRHISTEKLPIIKKVLRNNIISLFKYGVTDFICGGAMGFDTLCENMLLGLRDEEGYDLKLHLYLPCTDNTAKWPNALRSEHDRILSLADDYKYITNGLYMPDCMMRRNKAMANDASFCIAFLLNRGTGTGATVRYADEIGDKVINIANEIYGD